MSSHLITLNGKGEAAVYTADEAQVQLFHDEPDKFPIDISGWVIVSQADLAGQMSSRQLVTVYNSLAGESLVKFGDKSTGAGRVMTLVERNAKPFADLLGSGVSHSKAMKPKTRRGRADKGVHNIAPKERAVACRAGTKQQRLIEALAKGATMAQLLKTMSDKHGGKSWTEQSITSGFHEDVNTKKGYGVRTEVVKEGKPSTYIYHLMFPAGVSEVLPVIKSKTVSDA